MDDAPAADGDAPSTVFEFVHGYYDGGHPTTYAHRTRASAEARAEHLRANYAAPGHVWTRASPACNEDGYAQVGWNLGTHCYIYVGERTLHA